MQRHTALVPGSLLGASCTPQLSTCPRIGLLLPPSHLVNSHAAQGLKPRGASLLGTVITCCAKHSCDMELWPDLKQC